MRKDALAADIAKTVVAAVQPAVAEALTTVIQTTVLPGFERVCARRWR